MTDLQGKTALVTGSTSGIGKAKATASAARGAHVLIVGRNEQRATDVVAEIEDSGGSAKFLLTRSSDLNSARNLIGWATEAGGGHVDILTNNAGVALLERATQPPRFSSTRPSHSTSRCEDSKPTQPLSAEEYQHEHILDCRVHG